ncbi:MAG: VanW family protein [Acidimicrobiia bacterium]|nr:VanW family protein [Acidimicrobiia bacterium]
MPGYTPPNTGGETPPATTGAMTAPTGATPETTGATPEATTPKADLPKAGLPAVHKPSGFVAGLQNIGSSIAAFFARMGRGIAAGFATVRRGTVSGFATVRRGIASGYSRLRRLTAGGLPRPVAIGLIAFGSTLLAATLVFTVDRITNGGEVLGSVVVNGVDLGGLGERDAVARLQEMENALATTPVPVTAAGHTFYLDPQSIGFDLDSETMVAAAMRNGRSGTVFGQFGWWVSRIGGGTNATVVPVYSYDTEALADLVDEWETAGIAQPAYPGDVRVEEGTIVYEYPAEGLGIDRDVALAALDAALLDPTRSPVALTTRVLVPAVTDADIDAAVQTASELIADDVTLTSTEPAFELVLPRHLLALALLITRDEGATIPEYTFDFDEAMLQDYVAALGPYLETDAVDAVIDIDVETDEIEIIPSIPRQEPDRTVLMDEVWAALGTPDRRGDLAYAVGREADFSTADAEALGITGLIGEFTTYHPCCAPRVTNIHQIADDVDGALVMPGDVFSLNDHVGQRTVAKGYVCAPALLGNETVETGDICIGGGTSQFTTTLYNAAFFAGLEDVKHTPHSVYFSRYPEGREATLGWREPELIFRNNTDHAIIIKTHYTDTEITAKIYGDNGGLVVTAGLSGRYNHTPIVELPLRVDRGLACPYDLDNPKVDQSGSPGWTVTVYRYITYPDGTQTTEKWYVRYQGAWRITEYNPSASCT